MIDKTYDPAKLEREWYSHWEQAGYFSPQGSGSSYCIMIPPPNVTGSLHMGHAFQQTLMDILIRYHRMLGDNTLWQVGTDHAGIATQMVVERQLLALGQDRHQLGRVEFVRRIWQWKEESGGNITRQLRRLGASVDWQRERFTLDETLSKAVQEVFIRLYNEGLIYRGKRLVNWDPALLTAVSDLEVESEEEQGSMWYLRYPLVEPQVIEQKVSYMVVATTRPETMLGDVAVAVHPEDERYAALIGKEIMLPLANRRIPIIADKEVDPSFGTGCVKITPAHDFNDYLMGERHHLPKINIFTKEAKLNDEVPEKYRGMDRFDARKQILKDLSSLELVEKQENHKLNVPRGDRSGAILEPLLTDQWFVKTASLAKPAIEAVESGEIRFIPDNWRKTYFEWMNKIQDWCISRQLWWGHRIPAWYDPEGKIYVGLTEDEIRKHHKLPADLPLHQDEDVLDTWFSSALWPFSTLGWPEETQDYKTFYPTQTLITGFDIIFFWVARMVMFGLKFTGKIPFKDVYINGLILDQDGQKMSKTKGNVIDPLDLIDGIDLESLVKKRKTGLMQPQLAETIEKLTRKQYPNGIPSFGTDALRFTFAAQATSARYIRFDLARVEGYRFFCNKLWNASRYVLMNTEGPEKSFEGDKQYSIIDRWIISRWQETKKALHQHLEQYRFDLAAQALYDFTWHEYCDWYLELSKPTLTSGNYSEEIVRGTRHTLVNILEEMLRALHPIIPFITEEIWQKVKPLLLKQQQGESIMMQPYPKSDEIKIDPASESEINWIKQFILSIRNIRGEMNIAPGKLLPVLLDQGDDADRRRVVEFDPLLKTLAKLETIKWLGIDESKPASATALAGTLEIMIPMSGIIDKQAEIARLQKEIEKNNKDLDKLNIKLSNPNFIENAPRDIVEQDQKRILELQATVDKLQTLKKEMQKL